MNEKTVAALDKRFGVDADTEVIDGEVVDTTTGEVLPAVVPATSTALVPAAPAEEESEEERTAKEDFEYSRKNLKSIATDVQNALARSVEVATQTDNAKSFEAVAKLASAAIEAHRELQDTHEKRARTRVTNRPPAPAGAGDINIQQGVVFNGTPDELLRLLKPERT